MVPEMTLEILIATALVWARWRRRSGTVLVFACEY